MPPTDRFVISFAAEPPQETLPYGRWADTLKEHFIGAVRELDTEGEELGEIGEIAWFPDRAFGGRTYIPAIARTDELGYDAYGFVSFGGGRRRSERVRGAEPTSSSETAENNPDWKLDLNEEVDRGAGAASRAPRPR